MPKLRMEGAFAETSDLLDEIKSVFESVGCDFDECSADENECLDSFGEKVFRLYQIYNEAKEIVEG